MSSRVRSDVLVAAIAFTVMGLIAGWFAASQSVPQAVPQADPGAEPEEHHELEFEPEELRHMGVTVGALDRRSFVATRDVAARLVLRHDAEMVIAAPTAAIVDAVHAGEGSVLSAGQPLVDLFADALPPASLEFVGRSGEPDHEALHSAVGALRRYATERRLVKKELERLSAWQGVEEAPTVPKQRIIDLENALARAESSYAAARFELHAHGFDEAAIEHIEAGEPPPPWSTANRTHVLLHVGLWNDATQAALASITDDPTAWDVGALAELNARGLLSAAARAWIKTKPGAVRFRSAATRLLSGYSIAEVQRLDALGALEPRYSLRVPEGRWVVSRLHAQPGEHVARGHELATLRNAAAVRLQVTPVGSELGLLQSSTDVRCSATPVVPGTGVDFEALTISAPTFADGKTYVFADLTSADESHVHAAGVAYTLHVPAQEFEDVWVLPTSALVEDHAGPHVLIADAHGDVFEPHPVAVTWRDARTAILVPGDNPHLDAQTRIAKTGAFALNLALHADSQSMTHDHAH